MTHKVADDKLELVRGTYFKGLFGSRKWAEVRKWESVISHFPICTNTEKRNEKTPFSFFLFPFTQSFPHFQGAIVNIMIM